MNAKHRYSELLYMLPLVATIAYGIFHAVTAPFSDYAGYYFGSKQLLAGNYADAYDTHRLNLFIAGSGYKNIFVSYTPFTPFTAIVFSPFLSLDIATSKLLFNIFGSVVFLITVYRCYRHFDLPGYVLLIAPFVVWMPVMNNLLFGQAYFILFALLAEGFIALKKKKPGIVACWWGIAIVFKVFPAILLLYLIARKEYRAAIYLSVACLTLLLVSIGITGYHSWMLYASLLPRLNNGELNNSFTYMFQSFFMLAKNIFVYDKLSNPGSYFNNVTAFVISMIIFKTCILAVAIAATVKKNTNELLVFATWIIAGMLISPNGSSYSLVLLLFPLLAISKMQVPLFIKFIVPGIILLACNINIHLFEALPVWLQYPRLYLILAIFALLLWHLRLKISYKIILPILVVFSLTDSMKFIQKNDTSEYLLDKEEHILITGVFAAGGHLGYRYWSDKGEQTVSTNIPVTSAQNLSLEDNQVVYNGNRYTQAKDWKKDPLLIDNRYIVYLSDKNRGIGFFTLRKIELK